LQTKQKRVNNHSGAADHVQTSFDYLDILEALETDIIQ